jgi:hypothetical protein
MDSSSWHPQGCDIQGCFTEVFESLYLFVSACVGAIICIIHYQT